MTHGRREERDGDSREQIDPYYEMDRGYFK
jgi:hypothetical protein